jgi:predicted small lipoprotein YifL
VSHHSTPALAGDPERRRLLALLGLSVAGLVGACGKKGPLRLPEPAPSNTGSSDEPAEEAE